MTAVDFPQANTTFGPPSGLAESQVAPIRVYCGKIEGGSLDGMHMVVAAWRPQVGELAALDAGQPIFLTFIGTAIPPHMLTTDFHLATHPQ